MSSYLIVEMQLGEGGYVLGPLDQDQQLLLDRVAHVVDLRQLAVADLRVR